ncbi:MAG: LPS export ABC transporter permease LptG [Alphaproteobacteria bacterium]|nr:LPS export ABC transporter permease LptG [Alphaproteobacteria bacterium]
MFLSPVLSFYICRQFVASVVAVFALLCFTALVADFVELTRRSAPADEIGLGLTLGMAALRLPYLAQKIAPFAMLFGAMLSYHRLTRHHELIAARAAGVSVWQFLLPAIVIALAIGAVIVCAVNPLSSAMVMRYEQLEARFASGRSSLLALSPTGLWLREGDRTGQVVIHARQATDRGEELGEATFFIYQGTDHFLRRVDAGRAVLEDRSWRLDDVLVTSPEGVAQRLATYRLPTTLTPQRIQESFASPDTLSFWALPRFIATLEESGFSALRHRLHWHAVLAGPFLLASMVLIAAAFSLRNVRRGGVMWLVIGGVFTGFGLYFLGDVSLALGLSGAIPPILAAWSPTGVSALAGLALLFHLEDG